jgi:hypothetical protein
MRSKFIVAFLMAFAVAGQGQERLEKSAAERVNQAFNSKLTGDRLNCAVETRPPFLDFAFRFESGYILRCPMKLFEGKEGVLITFVRVTPEDGPPLLLGMSYKVPGLPSEARASTEIKKIKSELGASGGFVLGEGRYTVELLAADARNRFFQKKWKIKAQRNRQESNVEVTAKPGSVAPLSPHLWDGRLVPAGSGVRLTVLLDAAPMSPFSQKLRAWDRAFLLDSVSSVLRQIPCESVRLVAFNLDQQKEIFRQERLDRTGLVKLARVLHQLELGTVSVNVLKQRQGWADLLAGVSNGEMTSNQPSDLVVFLGPSIRIADKVPKEILASPRNKKPQFFYLEYYPYWRRGSEFPDAIHQLTSEQGGTVLKIHSPGELALALRKMLNRVTPGREDTAGAGSNDSTE